jgi:hypothetical protein
VACHEQRFVGDAFDDVRSRTEAGAAHCGSEFQSRPHGQAHHRRSSVHRQSGITVHVYADPSLVVVRGHGRPWRGARDRHRPVHVGSRNGCQLDWVEPRLLVRRRRGPRSVHHCAQYRIGPNGYGICRRPAPLGDAGGEMNRIISPRFSAARYLHRLVNFSRRRIPAPSRITTSWSASICAIFSTVPLGHRIVRSAAVAAPSPKCNRRSLTE